MWSLGLSAAITWRAHLSLETRGRACFALWPFAMTPEIAEQTIIDLISAAVSSRKNVGASPPVERLLILLTRFAESQIRVL
jgi:hypothetical protein